MPFHLNSLFATAGKLIFFLAQKMEKTIFIPILHNNHDNILFLSLLDSLARFDLKNLNKLSDKNSSFYFKPF